MLTEPMPAGRRQRNWLDVLLRAGDVLRDTPSGPPCQERLTALLVPALVDLCALYLTDPQGQLHDAAIRCSPSVPAAAIEALRAGGCLAAETAALATDLAPEGGSLLVRSAAGANNLVTNLATNPATLDGERWMGTAASVGISSAIVAPLRAHGRPRGVLILASLDPTGVLGDEDRRPVEELGRQVALALDAANLRDAAEINRSAADLARQRMAFLADASATLATSLDYRTTLQTVSRLAAPLIADCCLVRILEDDGSVTRAAVTHVDPELERLILSGGSTVLPDISGASPLAVALRTCRTIVLDSIGDDVHRASARDEAHLARNRRLAFTASITVPLEARGRRIGALTFATDRPGRVFDQDDVALGQDLARRAAVAIDNARLYGDVLAGRDELARQLEFTDAIVRDIAEGIAVVDRTGRITYINPVGEQLLGYASVQLTGQPFHDVIHVRDTSGAALPVDECRLQTIYSFDRTVRLEDETFRRADGTTFPVALSASPFMRSGRLVGAVIIFRDVGQERRSRELLRESEERLRRALAAARMMMWKRDLPTGRTIRSDLASMLLGRPNAELLDDAESSQRFVHPDDRPKLDAQTEAAIRTGQPNDVEYRVIWPDDSIHWVRGRGQVTFDANGKPLRMSGTLMDVTDRKLAELQLERLLEERQAEAEELRQLHEQLRRSLDAVLGLDEVGKLLTSESDLNAAGQRMLAIAMRAANLQAAAISLRDQRGALRLWQQVSPVAGGSWNRRHPAVLAARARAMETGAAQTYQLRPRRETESVRTGWCVPLVAKDGARGVLEAVGSARHPSEQTAEILGSIASQAASALENARLYRELADRERALRRLVQQLMSAHEQERARLARDVHDEVVQTATGAQQFLEAFSFAFPGRSDQEREQLATAVALAHQIVESIRRVLGGLRPSLLDDFGLAQGLKAYTERLAAEGLTVTYETSLGDERLAADVEIALYRVAQEALTNVRKHAGTRHAQLRLDRIGDLIVLEVQDDGRGFDPALTAGRDGSGARLGLLGIRERIAQIGGTVTIVSNRERGTLLRAEARLRGQTSIRRVRTVAPS
jgi:PAS domain S-box-containing protein